LVLTVMLAQMAAVNRSGAVGLPPILYKASELGGANPKEEPLE